MRKSRLVNKDLLPYGASLTDCNIWIQSGLTTIVDPIQSNPIFIDDNDDDDDDDDDDGDDL